MFSCNFGDDDRRTDYYSEWETCQVENITDDIVTLECNGVKKTTTSDDTNLKIGDLVTAVSEYKVYTEIEK